jgi:hypothetical protein
MNEKGADFGGVATWVEKIVVPVGPLVGAVEGFAFAPSAAGNDDRRRIRLRGTILHNQIRTVGNELCVDAENRGQRAFHLRGSVVLRLESANGRVDQVAEDGQVCENGGTYAEVWLQWCPPQIVTAKKCFWYLLRLTLYDAGAGSP